MNNDSKYHNISIFLHWMVGLAVLAQLSLGFWMEGVPKAPPGLRAGWFNFHKSTGMILAILILCRVVWRLAHRPPELPDVLTPLQKTLAQWNHRLLYACMLIMPLSGFLGSSFTPYPIKFFGTPLPRFWGPMPEMKEFLAVVHASTALGIVGIVVIHIAAALAHAYQKDGVAQRMWFSFQPKAPTPLENTP